MNFTEQDVQNLDDFGKFVSDRAEFRLTTRDAVQLVRLLNTINAIRKKMADNILEYRSITEHKESAE
jgi:hypothetical protein